LVIALRREAERLMNLQHFESAEIVLTEALTVRDTRTRAGKPLRTDATAQHCADGGVYAMHAECLEKLDRTQARRIAA